MNVAQQDTAVVFIDPQNEVLSETGLGWPAESTNPPRVQRIPFVLS